MDQLSDVTSIPTNNDKLTFPGIVLVTCIDGEVYEKDLPAHLYHQYYIYVQNVAKEVS